MFSRHALVAAFLLAAAVSVLRAADAPATNSGEAQPVNLNRPFKQSETYDAHFVFEASQTLSVLQAPRKNPPSSSKSEADLTGRISNFVSEDEGKVLKFKLTISHLLKEGRDSIRPGTVVLATVTRPVAEFKDPTGSPVPDNAVQLIKYAIEGYFTSGIKEVTTHGAFGSTAPRAINTKWSLNSDATIAFLNTDSAMIFSPFGIIGTARTYFPEGGKARGVRQLVANVECKDFGYIKPEKNMLVEGANGTYTFKALVPDDPTIPLLEEERVFDGVTNYTTAGNAVKIKADTHRRLKATISIAKPAEGTASAAPVAKP